ncbi:MAG: 30S ribosomal protein S4 [Deltaproteobacteria bacterium]|nr:30S ribosomal protein S4 [Deltaproteobacteria bacterium]MBI2181470.1 30S ribosomal protein S4 [Deltaproteobacteria bacterium]MBI2228542.1 30S ribosomal protein S4 [Deltaproteobacteria bacterium]MBI2367614.1 30S ribosomal protein S4 [Deltaproteobacteria bacterium]MBI3066923.1 30S ribosomal protein S4 [Deltaproteobacteria bacterium]
MARYTDSVCRLCRRENLKLFLKGERCYTDKCAIERRNYPPGQHGQGRPKFSEYSIQLREKQKVKRMYGLMENQFRRTFAQAARTKGITGETLLVLLERRLDNVAYRLGFASSRAEARTLVRHGHILVNGKKVNIPSYFVRAGDVVSVRERSRQLARVLTAMEGAQRRGVPEWAELDRDTCSGKIRLLPTRSDVTMPINEKLIVELYSK